ncbi:MAG: flagellar hook assembly protein FlgD [Thermodesulfobacteriota bacterium]
MVEALEASYQSQTGTKGASGKTASSLKEQFLHLLVTQLQHQDPLKPMEAKELTAQLAQFSLLEQAIDTNQVLKTFSLYGALANNARAAGLIGKEVKASCNGLMLGETGSSPIYFTLPVATLETQISIYDLSGRPVQLLKTGAKAAGSHSLVWDGKDSSGRQMAYGTYSVEILGKGVNGESVQASLYREGKVEAVRFQDGIPYLVVQGVPVSLSDVLEVRG